MRDAHLTKDTLLRFKGHWVHWDFLSSSFTRHGVSWHPISTCTQEKYWKGTFGCKRNAMSVVQKYFNCRRDDADQKYVLCQQWLAIAASTGGNSTNLNEVLHEYKARSKCHPKQKTTASHHMRKKKTYCNVSCISISCCPTCKCLEPM